MSAAYERVRHALAGTSLAGEIDKINAELYLTPDSPEWILAALGVVGGAALRADLQAVERALSRLPENLDGSMRAAGVEIVQGLAADVATATTEMIKSDAVKLLQEAADTLTRAVGSLTSEVKTMSKESHAASVTAIHETQVVTQQVAGALLDASVRIGGWTPARIASIAIGVLTATVIFVAGATTHGVDILIGCPTRTEHVTRLLHLNSHDSNLVRNYICGG